MQGFGASYVSGALLISESTARTHVSNIYRKLNVTCRDELLVLVEHEFSRVCNDGKQQLLDRQKKSLC